VAAKKTKPPKRGESTQENIKIEMIEDISPNKFKVGGAAILAEASKKHQVVKTGVNK